MNNCLRGLTIALPDSSISETEGLQSSADGKIIFFLFLQSLVQGKEASQSAASWNQCFLTGVSHWALQIACCVHDSMAYWMHPLPRRRISNLSKTYWRCRNRKCICKYKILVITWQNSRWEIKTKEKWASMLLHSEYLSPSRETQHSEVKIPMAWCRVLQPSCPHLTLPCPSTIILSLNEWFFLWGLWHCSAASLISSPFSKSICHNFPFLLCHVNITGWESFPTFPTGSNLSSVHPCHFLGIDAFLCSSLS